MFHFIGKGGKLESSKMSLGVRLWKTQNLMFFFTRSALKSSFRHSETPIFLLESWPCHTKFMCISIRAFQKYHKYNVSSSRAKKYKKKRGTRKGAVSAGYLVSGGSMMVPIAFPYRLLLGSWGSARRTMFFDKSPEDSHKSFDMLHRCLGELLVEESGWANECV